MKRRNFIHTINGGMASVFLFGSSSMIGGNLLKPLENSAYRDLKDHTIADIQFLEVQLRYPRLVGKNAKLDLHGYGPKERVCSMETDQGAKGWGVVRGGDKEMEDAKSFVKGKKLNDIFDPAQGVLQDKALPFDIALHDLAGVILDKPVYEMLGKKEAYITDCYSGMIYFDDLEPKENPAGVDKIMENCQFDYDMGYRQFKLKIGRGHKWMPEQKGLQRDIEVTKMVAENFPDCDVLVDGNNGFTADGFIKYLKGIEGVDLFWIEEPFHETEADYRKLKTWLDENNRKTLLADGEANPDIPLLRKLEKEKIIDVHLIDIIHLGFTPWRKLMPELKQNEIYASPHAWGSQLKTYYSAHLAGGLGNTITIEGVTCESDDIDFSDYKLQDGKLLPSSRPGFGMKLLK